MGTKVWNKSDIIENLKTDDRWVQRAVLALYGRQTQSEKASNRTMHQNKVGFSAFDAAFMSILAKRINHRGHLYPREIQKARPRLFKYAGQLAAIANSNQK